MPKFSIDLPIEEGSRLTFITGFSLLKFPLIALGVSSGGYISGHFIAE